MVCKLSEKDYSKILLIWMADWANRDNTHEALTLQWWFYTQCGAHRMRSKPKQLSLYAVLSQILDEKKQPGGDGFAGKQREKGYPTKELSFFCVQNTWSHFKARKQNEFLYASPATRSSRDPTPSLFFRLNANPLSLKTNKKNTEKLAPNSKRSLFLSSLNGYQT